LSGADLDVLAAVANLERAGFREATGFRPEDLVIYRTALEELLSSELQVFIRVAAGREFDEQTRTMARAAVDAATMLVVAVRRKLIMDLLSAADAKVLSALSGGKRVKRARRD